MAKKTVTPVISVEKNDAEIKAIVKSLGTSGLPELLAAKCHAITMLKRYKDLETLIDENLQRYSKEDIDLMYGEGATFVVNGSKIVNITMKDGEYPVYDTKAFKDPANALIAEKYHIMQKKLSPEIILAAIKDGSLEKELSGGAYAATKKQTVYNIKDVKGGK